jgi:hypothetical protein
VLRRDRPEEWKCQPNHWLSPELEFHEIVVGAFSLALGSFISATMAWDRFYKTSFRPKKIRIHFHRKILDKVPPKITDLCLSEHHGQQQY